MRAISPDTDRQLLELVLARGLVPEETVRALSLERTQRLKRGERPRSLAQLLCDRGLLERRTAATLLSQVRARKRTEPFHPVLDLPGTARERIGPYDILGELGRGGMGVVYRALDPALGRPVALKMILDASRADPEELERFHREARAAARLHHPGIVQVYGTGVHEGRPYIAFELIEGESLEALLNRKQLSPRRTAELVRKVALALDHAHREGILHRDVKPANVLLDRSGEPHLTDFGLARTESASLKLTRTGEILGTPAYMAPEQADGTPGAQGPWTDIYALGGVLYRALAGRPPFEGGGAAALIVKVLTQEPEPPRRVRPTVHPDLETIALRCLEKDPKRRYPSVGDVALELGRFLEGEPIAARPPSLRESLARWMGRNRALSVAVVALGLVVASAIVAGLVFKVRRNRELADHARELELKNEELADKNRELADRNRELVREKQKLKDQLEAEEIVWEATLGEEGKVTSLARESIEKALALDKDLSIAWTVRSKMAAAAGDYHTALESALKATEVGPHLAGSWSSLGSFCLKITCEAPGGIPQTGLSGSELLKKAEEAYGHVLDLRPGAHDAWLGRGIARFLLGDWDNALSDFTKGMGSANPRTVAEAHLWRGRLFQKKGQVDAARADFDAASRHPDPDIAVQARRLLKELDPGR
jgi:tetratricopeptide (TPR) repeat protein/RIO-like serine/threonine protein kinase